VKKIHTFVCELERNIDNHNIWYASQQRWVRIRTGSDCNFFENWRVRTGSDWENFCCFHV